jgi:hypothetical protein
MTGAEQANRENRHREVMRLLTEILDELRAHRAPVLVPFVQTVTPPYGLPCTCGSTAGGYCPLHGGTQCGGAR